MGIYLLVGTWRISKYSLGGLGQEWHLQHENRACRNDITPDSIINRENDTCDTVDNYVNSVDYFEKGDKK